MKLYKSRRDVLLIVFSTFLFFCLMQAKSQVNLNVAFHSVDGSAGDLVSSGTSYFYVSDVGGPGACNNSVTLISMGIGGASQWSLAVVKPASLVNVGQLIRLASGDLLLAGMYYGGHVQAPAEKLFVIKVTAAGQKIFDVDFADIVYWAESVRIAEAPDGSFYFAHADKLYHLSSTGVKLSEKAMPYDRVNAMLMVAGNRLLVNCVQGSAKNHLLLDTSGATITSIPGALPVYQYGRTSGGSIIAINDTSLLKFTPGLSMTGSYSIPQKGAKKMVIRNDSIHLVTSANRYLVLDSSLAVKHNYLHAVQNSTTDGIAINGGQLAFISNIRGRSHQQNSTDYQVGTHFAVTSFPVNQGFSYDDDIGVIDATCQSCIGAYYVPWNSNIAVINFSMTMNVTVKNYGTDSLKKFYLNCDRFRPFICGIPYYHQEFNVLPVAPGGTVQVTTDPFYLYKESTPPVSTFQFDDVGFFTSAPNRRIDGNRSNDIFSDDFNFTVTGIEKVEREQVQLIIRPNPVSDFLDFESNAVVNKLSVFSADGRLLFNQQAGNRLGRIDLRALPAGVYVVAFTTETGPSINRFIITR